ncbi:hypothetical protein [Nocardia cyriacigeorgica]|uniref:hypothetical protein n=1 Tax=Nocardia cyriacigeorgica TaxID=135487 RepID=UPI001893CAF6|nr:hypothetical protein [Nocardia cyriacigeorgica]MBF6455254.1 hypothetical protein [Nocardia cyriacigeorgica]MBF6554004.1 hypothetical protein [Nocardia cyriacigeorgica]
MDIDRATVPGKGVVHHFRTRAGARFALLATGNGDKQLLVYGDPPRDEPLRAIVLESDEADCLAELLHSAPLPDRVARLERCLDQLIDERGRR